MRPKSPFLQNLRTKTPEPQMKQTGATGPVLPTVASGVKGFQPFHVSDNSKPQGFNRFAFVEERTHAEMPVPEPQIDLVAERNQAFELGYAKAKAEFGKYKAEAEQLERSFQEILDAVQEARMLWVQEIREGVAESMQIALHHIAKHPKIQSAILAQKISEAITQLSEEKDLTIFVAPNQVELAQQFVVHKAGWTVKGSQDVNSGAILESSNGIWDARLQVTLDELDDILSAWMMDMGANS